MTQAQAAGRRHALGRYGEDLACRALRDDGLEILARNWRCTAGEIDIVAAASGLLVVCEVKTRASSAFGPPEEAVTFAKLRRLRGLAAEWLVEQGEGREAYERVRLDVVAVVVPKRGAAQVRHLKGVG